jgi:SAM-dependent methyltransferase
MNAQPTTSIRDSYDLLADEYATHLFGELQSKPLDRELLDRFASEVRGRGEVCDMGCGPGQVTRYLQDAGVTAFGLDLSPGMLEQARKLNPDIRFREGNMLALDLEDRILVGITAFYAIVNLPNQALPLVFQEMHRVLQPGGLLLLAFHIGDQVVQVQEMWGQSVELEFFFFQPSTIRRYLEAAGLEIEQIIERGPYAPEVEHQSQRAYIFARKPLRPDQR